MCLTGRGKVDYFKKCIKEELTWNKVLDDLKYLKLCDEANTGE